MDKKEMIWIASKAAEKRWDFETLKYGDEMYGREGETEDVWEYVEEYVKIGSIVFREKYKNFNLY